MKKMLFGALLLLALNTTHAAPRPNHGGEQNILSSELPLTLQSEIKTAYAGYWITDLKQEGEGKHAKYFLTIENPEQVLHLEARRTESWEVLSTEVKAD